MNDTAAAFKNMSPVDQLRMRAQLWKKHKYSPEEAAANKRKVLRDLLSVTPGPGNYMAMQDAVSGTGRTAEAIEEGNYLNAGLEGGMSVLNAIGALTGLPVGKFARQVSKGASSRTNVFVPVGDKAKVDKVRDMSLGGADSQKIHRETGLVMSPSGTVQREIPDMNMKLKSTEADNLNDALEHPELFEAVPQLRNIPVVWTRRQEHGVPVVRTNPKTGAFEISKSGGKDYDPKDNIAKLLQYRIAQLTGGPAALRHGDVDDHLTRTGTQALDSQSPHVDKLLKKLAQERELFTDSVARKGVASATNYTTGRSIGNMEAKLAKLRSRISPEAFEASYPHSRKAKYMPSGVRKIPSMGNTFPVFEPNASQEQVRSILDRWAKYGSGRDNFRDGGSVAGSVGEGHIGKIEGTHEGRADTRPVTLPEGGYVIPADVVAALGDGNTAAGHKKLADRFPGKRQGRKKLKHGGGVKAVVSDGEFVVSPEHISKIGGHDRLDDFVKKIRQHNIRKLASLPEPNK